MNKIKLDLTDRKILSELDKNCRVANSILAKKVNKSREAVKYRIQQLQNKGIIEKFITSINPNKLGYYMFKVYLKLENIPEERERFFEELKHNKDIYWMGISDGAFDCVFAILSKSITEYYGKINFLLSKWEHLIVNKILGIMVDTTQYNKRFFTDDKNGQYVVFGGNVVENEIDELNYKILNILANDARIPIAELARKINSTIEIVRGRIKKLEEKGIILNYRIAVDFNKLGLEFFKAIIYFRTLSEKDERSLFEWMRTNPNSLYYIRSLAPWEVEFEFAVESYQHFNKIINDLRKRFPHVIKNHEHLIMIYETWMPAYKEMLKIE
ncbi:MAG: winged helix-turn-helix transcriptional regulator [Candidatus Woesearchaeota archaeon]|nr:winged helix-turn-helix transcriptional regulator [Candidatus Woesearchaeota archaeon]